MKCLNRENWEQRVCPLGTWSFQARLGGNHAHTRASPLAAAAGRRRSRARARARVTADHTRSAIRIRTRISATAVRKPTQTVGRLLSKTNRCNRSVGIGPLYPSRSAINSAPLLSNKTHNTEQKQSFFCILKWDFLQLKFEVTSKRKWGFCNSNSGATFKRF